ncbi:hypothetical protein QJQ45_008483 [Haematococcus lacustris]|nr:hypothetical protein QJQ45_008483 [Haematococcus lacustris]
MSPKRNCKRPVSPAPSAPGPPCPSPSPGPPTSSSSPGATPTSQDQPPAQPPPGPVPRPQAPPWGRWLDRDTNPCLNFQRIGESMQRPLELCSYEGLEALPPTGKEYQQGYKRVNDRLPKVKQRAAEYRRGIYGRARNNAYFEALGVTKFDDFLDSVEDSVNMVVDISNDLNAAIDRVKHTTAVVTGAYIVEVGCGKTTKDHDRLLLTIIKAADGSYPTVAEVQAVHGAAKAADQQLAKARASLIKTHPTGLRVEGDVLAPASAPVTAFNTALTALREAVKGAGLKVTLTVKAAGVPGGLGVEVDLIKPSFPDKSKPKWDKQPLSVLDVALTEQAKAINTAEAALAEALATVAKALKSLPAAAGTLIVKGNKLRPEYPKKAKKAKKAKGNGGKDEDEEEPTADESKAVAEGTEKDDDQPDDTDDKEGAVDKDNEGTAAEKDEKEVAEPEADEPEATKSEPSAAEADAEGKEAAGKEGSSDEDAKAKAAKPSAPATPNPHAASQAGLRKAATAANTQIFKLVKACASINGPVSLVRGLTVVFQDLRDKIMKAAGGSAVQFGNIVSFKPIVTFNEEGEMDFDFDVKIDLPEFQGMGLADIVKALPGSAQLVYASVLDMKKDITALLPRFKQMKDAVMQMVDSADEVFKNPQDAIKEAMGDNANPMVVVKLVASASKNLMTVKDLAKVVQVFVASLKRLADELQNSGADIQKVLA